MTLENVLKYAESLGGNPIVLILHDSQRTVKDPPWIDFDVVRSLEDRQAGRLFVPRPQMSWVALGIQLAVLLILIGGGGVFYWKSTRPEEEKTAPQLSRYERIVAVIGEQGFSDESPLPALPAAVARTEHLLLLSNLSDVPWTEFEMEINPPNGYRLVRKELLPPGRTVRLSLRDFVKGETSLVEAELVMKRVRLRVPGFRDWEGRF